MSIWDKVKGKADELIGRAEEVYGQSHGDAAATVAGEARRLEGEAEVAAAEEGDGPRHDEHRQDERRHPDDDGLAGAR